MPETRKFQRYSLFPVKYPTLYKKYEDQRDAFWVPKEVDLDVDVKEWRTKLTDNDRHFLSHTLAFFAQADGIVLNNLNVNFSIDIKIPEATLFYGIQAGIESIHWEMYALLIQTLIDDSVARDKAFSAIENYPCIQKKAEWITKWMTNDRPFMQRLVAFACTEGIFFSSAFASIFYYKKQGLLPGLTTSNEFIARDEGMHRDFGCELIKLLLLIVKEDPDLFRYYLDLSEIRETDVLTESQALEIIKDSVEIEKDFVKESLRVELIGINPERMGQYVQFVADHLLATMGYKKYYNVANPFDWMEVISLKNKSNFFEKRTTEYKKNRSDKAFKIDVDF